MSLSLRPVTLREARTRARGNRTQVAQQIGNCVPCKLARAVLEAVAS